MKKKLVLAMAAAMAITSCAVPAFASDEAMVEENAGGEQNWFDETPQQNSESEANEQTGYICNECGAQISDKVYSYSINKFGKPLCVRCQRGAH